jgi:hypothetical protein
MIVLIVEAVAFQTSMVAVNRDWQQDVAASNEYARQRLGEGLVISNATISGAIVTLTFKNMGSIVAYVHHVWVTSVPPDSSIHESFPLGSLVVPPGGTVPHDLDVPAIDSTKTYDFKAVTTRGNVAQIRYPLSSTSTTSSGTTMSTTVSTTSYTTVSTTSYTTVSTTSSTTVSTTSYTTVSTTSSTTVSTTVSTTSYTTVSTTSYTTVSTTSYTTISTTNNSPDMISGTLMVAYQAKDAQGYDSASDSCHQEVRIVLTGISGLQTGSSLSFVNPWLTNAVLTSAQGSHTTMYYLVNATNTKNTSIVASAGTIDLTWYGSNHITGPLFGVYYLGHFYTPGSAPAITAGSKFYAIFKIDRIELSGFPGNVFFIGSAAITNNVPGATYYSAQLAIDGLWVRSSC